MRFFIDSDRANLDQNAITKKISAAVRPIIHIENDEIFSTTTSTAKQHDKSLSAKKLGAETIQLPVAAEESNPKTV